MALTAEQRDASMADDQMLAIKNALASGKLTTEQLPAMIARLEAGEGKTLTAGARLIVIERLQAMLQAPAPAQACKYCAQPSLEGGKFCQAHQDIRDAQAAKAAQRDDMAYFEIPITPASGGFGEWQAGQPGEPWASDQDLLEAAQDAMHTAVYCLGVDALPEGLEDISGRIRDEPEYVYGWLDRHGQAQYFGVEYRP